MGIGWLGGGGLGQISRRQTGDGVLLDEFLQQRRQARRRRDRRGRCFQRAALRGSMAFGIFVLIQGEEAAEDGAGARISQMHLAQIPGSCPHMDLLEMTVAGGHLKTNASQADGAVRAALSALDFAGEGQFQCSAVRTRSSHVIGAAALPGTFAPTRSNRRPSRMTITMRPFGSSLFQSQPRWSEAKTPIVVFDSLARAAGVELKAWDKCVTSHATAKLIEADRDRSAKAGVESTPTFFIGDRALAGAFPVDSFRVYIEQALAKQKSAPR